MSVVAPDKDARPPILVPAPPGAATALRRTARVRLLVRPRLWETAGIDVTHPYVRRFWSAALTGSAVADLLRLVRVAAAEGETPRPLGLPLLAEANLVRVHGKALLVRSRVPAVPEAAVRRWPPRLRAEHAAAVAAV